jgi:hypothetical protein
MVAVLGLASWPQFLRAADGLSIAEGHLFFAPRQERLFVLIDLWPQHAEIEKLGQAEREEVLRTTAIREALQLLVKHGLKEVTTIRVEFSYIKSMDEYARKDFSSMVRHGFLLIHNDGGVLEIVENKLDFKSE